MSKSYSYCRYHLCTVHSSYNYEGEVRALYCNTHKLDDMVDIKHKRCLYKNCTVRASYKSKGKSDPLYCKIHRKEDMINIKFHYCVVKDCMSQSQFSEVQYEIPMYCSEHKKDTMICKINRQCNEEDCILRASYNYKGEKKPVYCVAHKKDGMINIFSKFCTFINCDRQAYYNHCGEKKVLFCFRHKLLHMVNVTRKKTAKINSTNDDDNNKTYTITEIINFINADNNIDTDTRVENAITTDACNNARCIECNDGSASIVYKNYCLRCYVYLFPSTILAQNYKSKELFVFSYVMTLFPQCKLVYDKSTTGTCTNYFTCKIDIHLDMGFHIVIIEVDENQDNYYDTIVDNTRLMHISTNANRPIVLIRFNPDNYDNIPSCWLLNSLGVCEFDTSKETEWQHRLNYLRKTILYYCQEINKSQSTLLIHSLYFNKKV